MPALTRFTYGALSPVTVDDFTIRELSNYLAALRQYQKDQGG